jgi:hypothetical protein
MGFEIKEIERKNDERQKNETRAFQHVLVRACRTTNGLMPDAGGPL